MWYATKSHGNFINLLIVSRFCIVVSLTIYVIAGRKIFIRRNQLRAFSSPITRFLKNMKKNKYFWIHSVKTTEVTITSVPAQIPSQDSSIKDVPLGMLENNGRALSSLSEQPSIRTIIRRDYIPYSVNVSAGPRGSSFEAPHIPPIILSKVQQRKLKATKEADEAAIGYTKVAMIFFVSLLVTWVPSSIHCLYCLLHPGLVPVRLSYVAATVLPLMGFWNSVVYIATSWAAVTSLFSGHWSSKRNKPKVQTNPLQKRDPKMPGSEVEGVQRLRHGGLGSGYNQLTAYWYTG